MTDKHVQTEAPHSNMEKDPSTWVTGDEAMTGAQKSYLKTLSEEAKVDFDESLTKAEASKQIDALQQQTGRGKPSAGHAKTDDAGSARLDEDDGGSVAGEEDPGAAEGEADTARAMRSERAAS